METFTIGVGYIVYCLASQSPIENVVLLNSIKKVAKYVPFYNVVRPHQALGGEVPLAPEENCHLPLSGFRVSQHPVLIAF